jgi:hypothetical protein
MFTNFIFFRFVIIFALLSMATVACGPKPRGSQSSQLDSVEIEQSAVKNQYRIGFCWAYAAIGLIESKYKVDTGKTIDLSEEALGFYRIAEELVRINEDYISGRISRGDALDKITTPGGLEGWYVRANLPSRDAMELIDEYGVVPESEWTFKFTDSQTVTSLKTALRTRFTEVLAEHKSVSLDQISQLMIGEDLFPSVPPKVLSLDGRTVTSTDLAKNVMKFKSSDYVLVSAKSPETAKIVLAAMKRSLARGVSVPMGFVFDAGLLDNGVLKLNAESERRLSANPNIGRQLFSSNAGGHAVLVTDFVNRGGSEGALTPEELLVEINKDFDQLSYLKFKNSWGLTARVNESGIPVSAGSKGYYYMEKGYISAAASYGHFSVVVPKDIAESPFGTPKIHSSVTKTL